MKKKKGFTLIEIIVCISLITIISVGSFIGIKLVDKKILVSELNQITDKAVRAAQVYIETNKEASHQLYSNNNGVSLPLKLLVNEGLLNLDGTKLDDKSIENQYVVTFLGGTGSSDNCEKITSTTSWSNNKPIYLCMNGSGGSNLATIDPTKYGNRTYVSNEPYYFKGLAPNNWATLPDNFVCFERTGKECVYRIVYVDSDDSIVLVVKLSSAYDTNYVTFNGKKLSRVYFNPYATLAEDVSLINTFSTTSSTALYHSNYMLCSWYFCYSDAYSYNYDTFSDNSFDRGFVGSNTVKYINIRLPNTCKIVSGTGAEDNKYNIECK